MDASGHDTNSCWVHKDKIQDLVNNTRIVIAPSPTQNIGANPLPSHAPGPLRASINMVSDDDFSVDPTELKAPPRTVVR